jgi:hypothetical protein
MTFALRASLLCATRLVPRELRGFSAKPFAGPLRGSTLLGDNVFRHLQTPGHTPGQVVVQGCAERYLGPLGFWAANSAMIRRCVRSPSSNSELSIRQ